MSTDTETDTEMNESVSLGAIIRELRTQRGMTLMDLAEGCGLSQAMISKIENGLGNPSINSLRMIAKALGVPTALLFSQESTGGSSRVLFNSKRTHSYPQAGVSYTAVSSPIMRDVRLILIEAEPGAVGGSEAICHEGFEQGLIIEGQLELTIDNDLYVMNAGDTIAFPSTLPHRWVNRSDGLSRSVWSIASTHPLGSFKYQPLEGPHNEALADAPFEPNLMPGDGVKAEAE